MKNHWKKHAQKLRFFFCHTFQDLFFPLAMISEDFEEHDFDLLDFSQDL